MSPISTAKFSRHSLPANGNIDFVGLGDLGVLAVKQIGALQEKTMSKNRQHATDA